MDLITMLKTMLDGMGGTCAIFFLTLLFALPLGMVVALLRMSKVKSHLKHNPRRHIRPARHSAYAPAHRGHIRAVLSV